MKTWEDVCKNAKTKVGAASVAKKIPALRKQHSILFSTVPSRDQETGKKMVTADDIHEDIDEKETKEEKAKEEKAKAVPCKYGEACYRTDVSHLTAFSHPEKKKVRLSFLCLLLLTERQKRRRRKFRASLEPNVI